MACENRALQERQQQHGDEGDRIACVPYVAARCPFCARHKPFTYAVKGRTRYPRCMHCGRRFKSVEVGADSVVGWTASERT
jgi:hypothetical protein